MKRASLYVGMEVYLADGYEWNAGTEDIDGARAEVLDTKRYRRRPYGLAIEESDKGQLVKLKCANRFGSTVHYAPLQKLRGPYAGIAEQRRALQKRRAAAAAGQQEWMARALEERQAALLAANAAGYRVDAGNHPDRVTIRTDVFVRLLAAAGITATPEES